MRAFCLPLTDSGTNSGVRQERRGGAGSTDQRDRDGEAALHPARQLRGEATADAEQPHLSPHRLLRGTGHRQACAVVFRFWGLSIRCMQHGSAHHGTARAQHGTGRRKPRRTSSKAAWTCCVCTAAGMPCQVSATKLREHTRSFLTGQPPSAPSTTRIMNRCDTLRGRARQRSFAFSRA